MSNSPFFTTPRASRNQLLIPMGTHHVCFQCHDSFVCDVSECRLGLHGTLCDKCTPVSPVLHSTCKENNGRLLATEVAEIAADGGPQLGLFEVEQ